MSCGYEGGICPDPEVFRAGLLVVTLSELFTGSAYKTLKHSHVAQLSRSNPRLEAMCLLRNVQKEPRQQTQTTGFLCIRQG